MLLSSVRCLGCVIISKRWSLGISVSVAPVIMGFYSAQEWENLGRPFVFWLFLLFSCQGWLDHIPSVGWSPSSCKVNWNCTNDLSELQHNSTQVSSAKYLCCVPAALTFSLPGALDLTLRWSNHTSVSTACQVPAFWLIPKSLIATLNVQPLDEWSLQRVKVSDSSWGADSDMPCLNIAIFVAYQMFGNPCALQAQADGKNRRFIEPLVGCQTRLVDYT